MTALVFIALLVTLYVALGRSAEPADERTPLSAMTARELARTAAHGFRTLNRLHADRWGEVGAPPSSGSVPVSPRRPATPSVPGARD